MVVRTASDNLPGPPLAGRRANDRPHGTAFLYINTVPWAFHKASTHGSIFEAMDLKLDIGITDLGTARRKALEELLLKAPTISDAQGRRYEELRKAIDAWR